MVRPLGRCEIELEFDHNLLFEAEVNFEELAWVVVITTNELASALKSQGTF